MSSPALHLYSVEDFQFHSRFPTEAFPIFNPTRQNVSAPEAWQIVPYLRKVVEDHNGAGAAAPQLGIPFPVFVFKLKGKLVTCFKPKILEVSKSTSSAYETCLSFPGIMVNVNRPDFVAAEFIHRSDNRRMELELWGLAARVFQHEMDHLQGKTILHHGDPLSVDSVLPS